MPDPVSSIFLLLCLLQIKHMFADYFLQTPRMLSGRGEYLHLGRAQHAGVHALGSVVSLVLVGANTWFIIWIVVLEWIVHFNIDWGKARWSENRGYGPTHAGFWRAAGLDQALHHLTYVAMVWAYSYHGM